MNSKSINRLFCIFQLIVILIICIVTFRLCYLQLVAPEFFQSDTLKHLRIAANGTTYSYLLLFFKAVMDLSGSYTNVIIAFLVMLCYVGTLFSVKHMIQRVVDITDFQALSISIGCIFLSSLYVPVLQPLFYKGGLVTQPWHNMTYVFMRLFAVLTIIGLGDQLSHYQSKMHPKGWVTIALPLAISTAVKPSFLLSFSWTLLIFLILDAIHERFSLHALIQCIKMGSTVFPALIIMYLQSLKLYSPQGDSGIQVVLFSSGFFSLGVCGTILKLIRALTLPTVVIWFNRKRILRTESFIMLQYLISLAVAIMFRETGERAAAGNFYWSLYNAGFLLFAFIWMMFADNYNTIKAKVELTIQDHWYVITCSILTVWHVVSGIVYFSILSAGGIWFVF